MRRSEKGLSEELVREISQTKNEPKWMLDLRLEGLKVFESSILPPWGPKELSRLNFDEISYYVKPKSGLERKWETVPEDVRKRYEALGLPEGEQKYLAGLGAQLESEMIYHNLRTELAHQGIIFEEMSEAVRNHPDIVRQYFGKLIPPQNNKFAALNTAVWSGGSLVYIPSGVYVGMPLHNFFQMSVPSEGQFERTIIVAEEGSTVEFLEGCVAPLYTELSLHSGVVEIYVKRGAELKFSTMQNWSRNVFNLVTKRALVEAEGSLEWVDGNVGSGVSMKYPAILLKGHKAKGRLISLALAKNGQLIDSGGKIYHMAPETQSVVDSKSIVWKGGSSVYRGNVKVAENMPNCRSSVTCTSLFMEDGGVADTFPKLEILDPTARIEQESSVLRLSQDQLLYLQSRGLDERTAKSMLVGGFIEPFTSKLPMEYAVEFNKLLDFEVSDEA